MKQMENGDIYVFIVEDTLPSRRDDCKEEKTIIPAYRRGQAYWRISFGELKDIFEQIRI